MTASTEARRWPSSARRGTSKGMRFSVSVRLARTIRWATVGSGTRKARAISSVVSPPISRNVSATRASAASTGWQAVKMRRSRSSPMWSSRAASRSGSAASPSASSWLISWCLRSISLWRRRRSMARCLAAAISQAPGLSGMPEFGHCSSAATSASCASSSARPTSRTMRARPAMSLACSIRKTASTVRWMSVAIMATDHTISTPMPASRSSRAGYCLLALRISPKIDTAEGRRVTPLSDNCRVWRLRLSHLFGQAAVVLDRLARPKVLQLEHLPDLDLADLLMRIGAAPDPFDRLRKRLALQDPVTGDQLLGLCEGAVDHGARVARELDPCALGAWLQPVAIEHHAGLHHLLVEFRHCGECLLGGHLAGLGVPSGLDHHHESHLRSPISLRVREPGMDPALQSRRTEPGEIDKHSIFFDASSLSRCVLDLFL